MINYNYHLDILLIGDSLTGKTSFFNWICKNKYYNTYTSTVGVDYYSDFKFLNDDVIKINIRDSGNICQTLLENYVKLSDIIIMFINMNSGESQSYVVHKLKLKCFENKKIYIFGNIYHSESISLNIDLTIALYNYNLKIVTIDIKNGKIQIFKFYDDLIKWSRDLNLLKSSSIVENKNYINIFKFIGLI